jgi:hypothetical protein
MQRASQFQRTAELKRCKIFQACGGAQSFAAAHGDNTLAKTQLAADFAGTTTKQEANAAQSPYLGLIGAMLRHNSVVFFRRFLCCCEVTRLCVNVEGATATSGGFEPSSTEGEESS